MSVLVGKPAPDFTVPAVLADGSVVEEFTLADRISGKPAILFFYALDFSPVCHTELIGLDQRIGAFNERGVEVIGISVDSHFSHQAWRRTAVEEGGIGTVRYTLAADLNRDAVRAYDVGSEYGTALRAAFLIDHRGMVRCQVINDLPLGRNLDELVRLTDALQFHDTRGEGCPAGWQKGDKGIPASAGFAAGDTVHLPKQ